MANNYKENMFAVPIVHIQVSNWKNKKKKLLDLFHSIKMNYRDDVWTNYHDDNTAMNHDVKMILEEDIIEFHKIIGFRETQIASSWFEQSKTNNQHNVHTHGAYGYSSVCFIEYDKEYHTPTQFTAPFLNFLDGNILSYSPKVDEGSLIFFPSSIPHYTFPNTSNKSRIILSFNLDVPCDSK